MNIELQGIPETLLIPLWAKANESNSLEPIIVDPKAVEIISQIDYDFSRFGSGHLTQLGVSVRTMLLDNALTDFLDRKSDAVVINMGAGLDTRHERLGLKDVDWYELDLPEAINIRRSYFAETQRYRFIPKSIFDYSWMDQIEDNGLPVMLIAEGLLMYFEEYELKPLFQRLAERFTGAEMLLETMGPLLVGQSKHHETVSKISSKAEFKWGISNGRVLCRWHPGIDFIQQWTYADYFKKRAGILGYIIRLPFIRTYINNRIVHIRFTGVS